MSALTDDVETAIIPPLCNALDKVPVRGYRVNAIEQIILRRVLPDGFGVMHDGKGEATLVACRKRQQAEISAEERWGEQKQSREWREWRHAVAYICLSLCTLQCHAPDSPLKTKVQHSSRSRHRQWKSQAAASGHSQF